MHYELVISDEARDQLRSLPKPLRRSIGHRLDLLQEDLAGNVKKLSAQEKNTGCESGFTASCFSWKVRLFLCMLSNTGGMHMDKSAQSVKSKRVTLRELSAEVIRLRKRVEDLEDLRDLNEAIARNKGKPGTPWEQVRKELEL